MRERASLRLLVLPSGEELGIEKKACLGGASKGAAEGLQPSILRRHVRMLWLCLAAFLESNYTTSLIKSSLNHQKIHRAQEVKNEQLRSSDYRRTAYPFTLLEETVHRTAKLIQGSYSTPKIRA
jgi:hypothetical protein